MATKYIQTFDRELPHYTGLVFKVKEEIKGYYLVEDILSSSGVKLNADGYKKNKCKEIPKMDKEYMDIMLERTRIILEFQKDK